MSSSASTPTLGQIIEEIQALREFVEIIQLVKLFSLSSMVLYVYNYVLTFDSEVSVMWKASFGFGKVLYFVLRYCTLVSTIFLNIGLYIPRASPEFCAAKNIYYWVSAVIIALATDFGLQLRVYALYQGSRKILALLVLLSLAMIASFATFLTIILRHDYEKLVYFGPDVDMYICNGSALPPVYDKIWIAKLVNEALMFLLALNKGIKHLRAYKGTGAASRLIVLLVKDSVLYFFAVFAFCLMSQLVWMYAGQAYIELPIGLTLAIGSIMSQKLMVNVRMQVMDKVISTTGTDVRYARPTTSQYTVPGMRESGASTVIGTLSVVGTVSHASEV